MADRNYTDQDAEVTRRPDFFTMIMGVAALLVSTYVLTNGSVWLPMLDARWLIAGGAVLVGILLLASSLRGGRGRR